MLIKNGIVLHYNRLEVGSDLRIKGGQIAAICPALKPEQGEQVFEATDCYVLPGVVDLHNHGIRHVMAQYDSLIEYAALLAAEGVTTCVVTLIGNLYENVEAMHRGLQESDNFRLTPNLVGFRPEIFYVAKTGAGSANALAKITVETTETLYTASRGTIRIWDVSPELPGAIPYIQW